MAAVSTAAAAVLRQSPAASLRPSAAPISASLRRSNLRLRPLPAALRLSAPLLRLCRRSAGRGAAGAIMFGTAAASYANALADVAVANGTLDATLADTEKIDQVFSEPKILAFFTDPTIPVEKKREIIDEIAAKAELQPHVVNFINILLDMNRIDIIKEIVKEFETAYNKITGTEVAVVTSVIRLESQDLAQIAQAVQRLTGAKNVRIKTVIDPSLIAGFTVRYGPSGSKLIDMSVKKQLDEIKAQLDFSSITLV